jgi:transcriptional regulator with XRE-family HTH domain
MFLEKIILNQKDFYMPQSSAPGMGGSTFAAGPALIRQQIGATIKCKRKALGMDQQEFGAEIWGDQLTPTAAQSRISRIERGELWPRKNTMLKIFDRLNIWDEAFFPAQLPYDILVLDPACEKYIPHFREMITLLSEYALNDQQNLFCRQLQMICDTASAQYENSKKDSK